MGHIDTTDKILERYARQASDEEDNIVCTGASTGDSKRLLELQAHGLITVLSSLSGKKWVSFTKRGKRVCELMFGIVID